MKKMATGTYDDLAFANNLVLIIAVLHILQELSVELI